MRYVGQIRFSYLEPIKRDHVIILSFAQPVYKLSSTKCGRYSQRGCARLYRYCARGCLLVVIPPLCVHLIAIAVVISELPRRCFNVEWGFLYPVFEYLLIPVTEVQVTVQCLPRLHHTTARETPPFRSEWFRVEFCFHCFWHEQITF